MDTDISMEEIQSAQLQVMDEQEVDHGYSKEEYARLVEQAQVDFPALDKWIIEGMVHKYMLGELMSEE